jgi:hypothetical protein
VAKGRNVVYDSKSCVCPSSGTSTFRKVERIAPASTRQELQHSEGQKAEKDLSKECDVVEKGFDSCRTGHDASMHHGNRTVQPYSRRRTLPSSKTARCVISSYPAKYLASPVRVGRKGETYSTACKASSCAAVVTTTAYDNHRTEHEGHHHRGMGATLF